MAKPFYFQLEPMGLGTFEVECLGSYLRRLAFYHGATLYQFLAHLDAWFHAKDGRHIVPLTRKCQDGQYGGYTTEVSHVVQVLELATGLSSVRAMTLLPLQLVCAHNGIEAVKHSRAWCPACYAEAKANGSPVYDRLLWQIQSVHRCPVHNIQLAQRCWLCGEIQRGNVSKTALDRCAICDASLADHPIERRTPAGDIFNLTHVESLLEFTSSAPNVEFKRQHFDTFCEMVVKHYDRGVLERHLGNVFHSGWRCRSPTLQTLLAISSYFDAPVHWILSDPIETAAQMVLGFDPVVRKRATRRYGDPVKARKALQALNDAINGQPPYPSVLAIASIADTNTGYLNSKYRSEVETLVRLRKKSSFAAKRARTAKAARLFRASAWPANITTEKERIRWVARHVGTSISHVRQIRKAMEANRGPQSPTAPCGGDNLPSTYES